MSSEVALKEPPSDQAKAKFPSPPDKEMFIAPVLSPKHAILVELDNEITGIGFVITDMAFPTTVVATQPVPVFVTSTV